MAMLSRIRIPEISQKAQLIIFFLSIAALTNWVPNSMADASIYFNGGKELFHGDNPYDGSSPFFSAPTGAKFLYLVGKLLLITQFPFVWNFVNILGVSLFFYVVLKVFDTQKYILLIVSLLLVTAPVREMVVNNQVTGFVLGLSSICIYLARNHNSNFAVVMLFFPVYISFELKPNLILGFLIYYLWANRGTNFLRRWFPVVVFLIANSILFSNQYQQWINNISSQGIRNVTGFESLGISTLVYESNVLNYEIARAFGIAIFAITFCVYLFNISRDNKLAIFSFSPLVALSFPYLHFLDLIVILPFIFPRIFYRKSVRIFAPVVLALMFLPRPSDSQLKNVAIVLVVALISTLQIWLHKDFQDFLLANALGFALVVSNYSLPLTELSDHEIQNFTVLRAWLVTCILMLAIIFQPNQFKLRTRRSLN